MGLRARSGRLLFSRHGWGAAGCLRPRPGLHLGRRSLTTLPSEELLNRARAAAVDHGLDVSATHDPYLIVDWCQQSIIFFHSVFGDAALSIIAGALLVRVLSLPWNLRSLRLTCDKAVYSPVYMRMAKAIMVAKKRAQEAEKPADELQAKLQLAQLSEKFTDFTQHTRFSPFQGMGYLVGCLMPTYFLLYTSLRGMMAYPDSFRAFVTAPALWMDSAVLSDPLGLMPGVMSMVIITNVEVNTRHLNDQEHIDEENTRYMKMVMRGATLTFAPMTLVLPSGMLLYLTTHMGYTALSLYLYRRFCWTPPKVKSLWK